MKHRDARNLAQLVVDMFKDDPRKFQEVVCYDPAEGSWFKCSYCGAYWDDHDRDTKHNDGCKAKQLIDMVREISSRDE